MVKRARLDKVCAEAVDLARSAAEATGDGVGDYLGAEPESERVVTHRFDCTLPGYRGWRWAVVVARAPRARNVTVSESALLPGEEALTAPEWVPWSQRLRAGDVGVGDLLPAQESDERLMPALVYSDDVAEDLEDIAADLGAGRARVMTREGRMECAQRWYDGDPGPHSDISTAAPVQARCGTCGFYLQLAGSLRQAFGVCGNVYAADDARVVAADHGCGAHSEVLTESEGKRLSDVELRETVYDDNTVESVDVAATDSAEDGETTAAQQSTDVAAEPAETVAEPEAAPQLDDSTAAASRRATQAADSDVVDQVPAVQTPAETSQAVTRQHADPASTDRSED